MYTLWNCHHNKSRYDLSPYRVNTVLFPIFPMPYIISHDLFYNWKIVLSRLTPLATPKPYSPLATTNLFSYILFSILLFFVVLHIPLISEIIWYIFFSVWLISLSIIPSGSSMFSKMARFHYFYRWVISCYEYYTHTHTHTHFIHSSVTLRFIACLCYCK